MSDEQPEGCRPELRCIGGRQYGPRCSVCDGCKRLVEVIVGTLTAHKDKPAGRYAAVREATGLTHGSVYRFMDRFDKGQPILRSPGRRVGSVSKATIQKRAALKLKLDELVNGARCGRCRLRGEHECLPTSADQVDAHGPGWVW